jgi:hypothetical protein
LEGTKSRGSVLVEQGHSLRRFNDNTTIGSPEPAGLAVHPPLHTNDTVVQVDAECQRLAVLAHLGHQWLERGAPVQYLLDQDEQRAGGGALVGISDCRQHICERRDSVLLQVLLKDGENLVCEVHITKRTKKSSGATNININWALTNELVCVANNQKVQMDRGEPASSNEQAHETENNGVFVFSESIVKLEMRLGCRDSSSERAADRIVDKRRDAVRSLGPVARVDIQVPYA